MRKILSILITFFLVATASADGLVNYVNSLQGTNSKFELTRGNTYATLAMPWGMNFWTAQTANNRDGWIYQYFKDEIKGFRQTHQCSSWTNDYAAFSLMPLSGTLIVDNTKRGQKFSHDNEIAKPHYYKVTFDNGLTTEMTPTERGVHFKFDFPTNKASYIVVDGNSGGSMVHIFPEERKVIGYCKNANSSVPANFANYFIIVFNQPFTAYGTYDGTKDYALNFNSTESESDNTGAYLKFEPGVKVEAQVVSSFISHEQAELNFEQELKGKTFDELKKNAEKAWNEKLGKIEIEGATQEQLETFYSCFFRSMLFPRKFYEKDKNNNPIYYSPYDGNIHEGTMYTDNGFWDTFRAQFPLNLILHPSMHSDYVRTLMEAYDQSNWLPSWSFPGHSGGMIGNHAFSLLADAYVKGVRTFDPLKALKAMKHDATAKGPGGPSIGRDGWEYYFGLGYIPYPGVGEATAKTLEYCYDDFCAMQVARLSGNREYEEFFGNQIFNYRNVYDPVTRFMRGRQSNGEWTPNFSPIEWGGPFTEGCAWHWHWSVMHDIQGLINLMGGDKNFVAKIDSVFSEPSDFKVGSYGYVIHEMTEMVMINMGQYAHGNQPIQHMVYLYNYAGEPWKTQKWVRKVMTDLYNATEDGYPGDEDQGQMSSWYVISAMGLYSVCPGTDQYVIGSPLFPKMTVHLENGKKLIIEAQNNSPENIYIQSASLNGKNFTRSWLTYDEIMNGGTLHFEMGNTPNTTRGINKEDAPFSVSRDMIKNVNNEIRSQDDLSDIRLNPDGDYILMNDIEVTGEWIPIRGFTGTLDGNGHIISGLRYSNTEQAQLGLFAYTEGATIKRLGIEDAFFNGNEDIGGIVGLAKNTTIEECYVSNSYLEGRDHIGGIVGATGRAIPGSPSEPSIIKNCYSSATIHSREHQAGGIMGVLIDASIENCYFSGVITCEKTNAAGIVTLVDRDDVSGKLTNCVVMSPYIVSPIPTRIASNDRSSNTFIRSNNYACTDMKIGNTFLNLAPVLSSNAQYGKNKLQGANVSATDLKKIDFYQNILLWDMSKWKFIDDDAYPVLNWQTLPIKSVIIGNYQPSYTVVKGDKIPFFTGSTLGQDLTVNSDNNNIASFSKNDNKITIFGTGTTRITINTGTKNENISLSPVTLQIESFSNEDLSHMIINTTDDLRKIENLPHACYFLAANLDLKGTAWDAICSQNNPFTGTLDGQGHTIKNVTINRENSSNQGFFGYINNATIQNLNLENVHITGKADVGGLVGKSTGGKIHQVSVRGYIEGNDHIGGLIGGTVSDSQTLIENCFVHGNIKSNNYQVGGLVGAVSNTLVANSYFAGTVTGPYSGNGNNTGGIYGLLEDGKSGLANVVCAAEKVYGGLPGKLIARASNDNCLLKTLSNTYYNEEMEYPGPRNSDDIKYVYVDNVSQPKSLIELRRRDTYENIGWDFASVWKMNDGFDFPQLKYSEGEDGITNISKDSVYRLIVDNNQLIVKGGQDGNISVFTLNGTNIRQGQLNDGIAYINLPGKGIYVVNIDNIDNVSSYKIINK